MLKEHQRLVNTALNQQLECEAEFAQPQLYRGEQFYKLFKQHSAIMLLIDPHARLVIDANSAAAKFYGYALDVLIGMSVEKINARSESEMQAQRRSVLEGNCNQFLVEHRLSSGDIRTVEVLTSPINVNGTTFLFSIIQDQTERLATEKKLRFSEALYRKLTEKMQDVIWVMDAIVLQYLYVSPSVTNLLGYSPDEIIASMPGASLLPDVGLVKQITSKIGQINHENSADTEFFNCEVKLQHKNGTPVWTELTVHQEINEHTGAIEIHGTSRNISERKKIQEELESQAQIDFLTGVDNRRYFIQKAEAEFIRSVRYQSKLSLLMIDIDFFKQINDHYGHEAGDNALKRLGEISRQTLRQVDAIGRIGGEEFAVLLPETDPTAAKEVAERLRLAVANERILVDSGLTFQFHISIGVSSLTAADLKLESILSRADKALYVAKNTGRNQVCVADDNQQRLT